MHNYFARLKLDIISSHFRNIPPCGASVVHCCRGKLAEAQAQNLAQKADSWKFGNSLLA